ncbi:hypothetical protein B484DRAFT_454751, partial [Ochromonadaceae sp. CCMP2298]
MDWQKLDLEKALSLKREVDVALQRLAESATNPEINRKLLTASIQQRIQEIEAFCTNHSDDERTILVEKEHLRLRQAMQVYHLSTRDGQSVASAGAEKSTSTPSKKGSIRVRAQRSSASSRRSHASSQSLNQSQTQASHHTHDPIYAWEGAAERPPRVAVEVGGSVFLPSSMNGFYSRQDNRSPLLDSASLPERYCDFIMVLTEEELTTLAARKKANKMAQPDGALALKPVRTLHSSTPYIEPHRIYKEMLRQENPDKWIADGLR